MEAGYGEGEIVQSFRLLNWSFLPSNGEALGYLGVEKLKLMMTRHLYIKVHALLRRLFTSSAHLFCHILIACYPFAY